jgi:hypothetical protein
MHERYTPSNCRLQSARMRGVSLYSGAAKNGEKDKREYDLSLHQGIRILSVHTLTMGVRIWMIAQADRLALRTSGGIGCQIG